MFLFLFKMMLGGRYLYTTYITFHGIFMDKKMHQNGSNFFRNFVRWRWHGKLTLSVERRILLIAFYHFMYFKKGLKI